MNNIVRFRCEKRSWDAAESEIFALSQLDPDRKIYKIYLDRTMYYRENPTGAD